MNDLTETVDGLLAEVEELLSESSEDPEALLESDELRSNADEARELVADAELPELLRAVGVDVPEDTGPGELMSELEDADPEALARLRQLQLLADVAEDGDEVEGDAIEEFEVLGGAREGGEDADDILGGDHDGIDLAGLDLFVDGEESTDEPSAETEDAAVEEGDEAPDAAEADADETGDADSDRVEEGEADEEEADEETEADAGDEKADEDEEDTETARSVLGDAVDELVEGISDSGESESESKSESEEERSGPSEPSGSDSGSSTAHSTVPSSDRADMRIPPHHSTVPEKDD